MMAYIHFGDQYMLTDPPPIDGNGDWAGIWYVSKDRSRGVLFAFRLASAGAVRTFELHGLLLSAHYRLRTPEGWSAVCSGAELTRGLTVRLDQRFRSSLVFAERE